MVLASAYQVLLGKDVSALVLMDGLENGAKNSAYVKMAQVVIRSVAIANVLLVGEVENAVDHVLKDTTDSIAHRHVDVRIKNRVITSPVAAIVPTATLVISALNFALLEHLVKTVRSSANVQQMPAVIPLLESVFVIQDIPVLIVLKISSIFPSYF